MTQFMNKSFSVHLSGDSDYRDRWEATFRPSNQLSECHHSMQDWYMDDGKLGCSECDEHNVTSEPQTILGEEPSKAYVHMPVSSPSDSQRRRERAQTGAEYHAKPRTPTTEEAKAIAEGQAKLRAMPNASSARCSQCGARRILADDGTPLACSLVPGRDGKGGCPSPLYDYEREQGTKDTAARSSCKAKTPEPFFDDSRVERLWNEPLSADD